MGAELMHSNLPRVAPAGAGWPISSDRVPSGAFQAYATGADILLTVRLQSRKAALHSRFPAVGAFTRND